MTKESTIAVASILGLGVLGISMLAVSGLNSSRLKLPLEISLLDSSYIVKDNNGILLLQTNDALKALNFALASGDTTLRTGDYFIGTSPLVANQSFMQGIAVSRRNVTLTCDSNVNLKLTVGNSRLLTAYADGFHLVGGLVDGQNLNNGQIVADGLIVAQGSDYGSLNSVKFQNGLAVDAFGTFGSLGWLVADCDSLNCQHGFVAAQSSSNHFLRCTVHNSLGVGFLSTGLSGIAQNNVFELCEAFNGGQDAFQFLKSMNTTLKNCGGYSSAWNGLSVVQSAQTHILNTILVDNLGCDLFIDSPSTCWHNQERTALTQEV